MIDALRGLASVSVAWAHIVNNTNPLHFANLRLYGIVKATARDGYLGVYIFFVVSGFVIPLALLRLDYSMADFPRFIMKRLVRLQPPYYVSILFSLFAAYAAARAPGFQGQMPHFTILQVLLHLFYLPPVFGLPWIDPVYWSLLVEVEYYVCIGLAMPFLLRASSSLTTFLLCAACFAPLLLPSPTHLLYHAPFFVIGVALCFVRAMKIKNFQAAIILLTALAAIANQRETPYLICAFLTIGSFRLTIPIPGFCLFLGRISYSLYLVHYVVGIKIVHLLSRYADADYKLVSIYLFALSGSIFVAWIFYRLFERPSFAWSSRIKLARNVTEARADAAISEVAP